MKKRILMGILILAAACCVAFFLYPQSFAKLTAGSSVITITAVKNDLEHTLIREGAFEADSDAYTVLRYTLDSYSYHRSLRTIFSDASMSGNDAGYWLYIYIDHGAERTAITCGGTGEIIINDRVYRMGYWRNKTALAFMEDILAILFDL